MSIATWRIAILIVWFMLKTMSELWCMYHIVIFCSQFGEDGIKHR